MADPNAFVFEDENGNQTPARKISKQGVRDAAIKRRDQFRENRRKYRETPMPAPDVRTQGGISGAAAKNVNKLYRNLGN